MTILYKCLDWIYLLAPLSAAGLALVIFASMGTDFGWGYALSVFFGFLLIQLPIAFVGLLWGPRYEFIRLICLILSVTLFLISLGFWIHIISDALTLNDIQTHMRRRPR